MRHIFNGDRSPASRQVNTASVPNSAKSGEQALVQGSLDVSIKPSPVVGPNLSRRKIMNYIVSSAALAAGLPVTTAAARAIDPTLATAPQAAGGTDVGQAIAWVRSMRDDGWVFSFKAQTYRDGQIVPGDPLEVDDYALCRPSPGRPDDTERLIAAMHHQEHWRSAKAALRTAGRTNDPIFAAIDEYDRASAASVAATERLDSATFVVSDHLGRPRGDEDLDWYKRAGLDQLKADFDAARDHYRRAWNALRDVVPTTLSGAASIVQFVLDDAEMGLDVDEEHLAMLRNALRALPPTEKRSDAGRLV
jgi:hypothetical protein